MTYLPDIFEDSVGIRWEAKYFDLHAFFSLAHVSLWPAEAKISLELSSVVDFRAEVDGVKNIQICFLKVSSIEFSPGFCSKPSDTIEEIGFKAMSDRDDSWLKTADQYVLGDQLFLRMQSLEYLRISFEEIEVNVL